jgi:hypothetical protein
MVKKITNKKTYAIDTERSHELARFSIDMGVALGKTVTRQSILDALVLSLADKAVYKKVLNIIKKI